MDFPTDDGVDTQEKIDAVIRDLQPAGTVEIGFFWGRKVKDGPVHCFMEFYGVEVENEDSEVISEEMRLQSDLPRRIEDR